MQRAGTETMWILMVYVLIVVIGEIVVVAIGLVLDRIHPVLSCQFPCRYSSPYSRFDKILCGALDRA